MTLKDQLLALATGYAAHEGISLVRLSSRVFDDGKKLTSLAERGDITTARFERGMAWFSENWPHGAEWPDGVPKPRTGSASHNSDLPQVVSAHQ